MELVRPTPATSALPKEQRAWSCPYCDKGLPELNRYLASWSRQYHVLQEHPGKNMRQVYKDYRKIHKEEHRSKYRATAAKKDGRAKYRTAALKKQNAKLGKRGHEIGYLPVIFEENAKGYRRPKEKYCMKCRKSAKTISSRESAGHKCDEYKGTKTLRTLRPTHETWARWHKLEEKPGALKEFFNMSDEELRCYCCGAANY